MFLFCLSLMMLKNPLVMVTALLIEIDIIAGKVECWPQDLASYVQGEQKVPVLPVLRLTNSVVDPSEIHFVLSDQCDSSLDLLLASKTRHVLRRPFQQIGKS